LLFIKLDFIMTRQLNTAGTWAEWWAERRGEREKRGIKEAIVSERAGRTISVMLKSSL